MKKIIALTIFVLLPLSVYAGEKAQGKNSATTMVQNIDGLLKQNEYEVISTNGAITRAFCPYTCAMRGIEAKHCKTWRSTNDPTLCYVQDTRIKTDAIMWGDPYKAK
jgi:NAD-dependent SIR2 family protein deacetylase